MGVLLAMLLDLSAYIAHRSPLKVSRWKVDTYCPQTDLIQLEDIVAHVVLTEADISGNKCWVTVTLNRASNDIESLFQLTCAI